MPLLPLLQFYQPCLSLKEIADRVRTFTDARQAADESGKPLLNVGCPSTNPMGVHACGDVCLDLDPSRLVRCTAQIQLRGDVREIPYPDGYFGAATCFHTLEHLPTVADVERALAELQRVADRVYVLSPSRWSPTAWLNPGHTIWPIHQDDGSIRFEQRYRGTEHGEVAYPILDQLWGAFERGVWALKAGLPPDRFMGYDKPEV